MAGFARSLGRMLLAVVAAALTAACATDTQPAAAPETALEWNEDTAQAAATSPAVDAGAGSSRTLSQQSPEEFVSTWFATLNDAYRTGDVAGVEALTEPDCTACAEFVTRMVTVTVPGDRARADVFSVRTLPGTISAGTISAGAGGSDLVVVPFTYTVNAVELVSTSPEPGSGDEVETTQAEPTRTLRAVLARQGSGWSMAEIGP